jgi:Fe-S-cluster containining protein
MNDENPDTFHDELLKALIARGRISADILKASPEDRKRLVRIGGPAEEEKSEILRDPGNDGPPGPPVNCAERIHLCKAVCCKLGIALSQDEVDRGLVAWEPEQPYMVRHEADGYCSHLHRSDHRCGIYGDRPQPCRIYSCARDPRIWTDFEGMVLNTAWIEAATGGTSAGLNSLTDERP